MAEKNSLIEQMLENLVNGEQQKAEELFHEYVVAKSREIYEGLIESEMKDDEDEEDEEVEEATEADDEEDDEIEETLDDEVALEADDEDEMDLEKDDPTDDLAADLDSDMGDEEGDMDDKSEEELFQDLDSIVDELQQRFDELKDDEMDMGDEEEVKDDFDADLETVREYVEKVKPCDSNEHADNTKSVVDNMKNDMGGTTSNIAKGGEEKGRAAPKAEDMKTGNVNVPGGKAGDSMSKASGHGAEKKGTAEKADNTASLFRGRR